MNDDDKTRKIRIKKWNATEWVITEVDLDELLDYGRVETEDGLGWRTIVEVVE